MDETELKALWAQDTVPARDMAFELAVMARIEQRCFRRAMAMNVALAVVGALLLALLMPTLEAVWQDNFAATINNWMIAAILSIPTLLFQRRIAQRD